MNRKLLDDIKEILGLVLELEPGQVDIDLNSKRGDAWDSLAHLNLILALEEKYGIEFTPEELEEMITVGDIIKVVEKKLTSRKI